MFIFFRVKGVAHGDELHYLFKFDDQPYNDTEKAISSKMIGIFYSFMRFGLGIPNFLINISRL